MNKKLSVFSWCIFDFGSTVFMMNVVSLCFVKWLDQNFGDGDARYSVISATTYMISLVLYPIIGEICDRGWKLLPLALLTFISIAATFFIGYCNLVWTGAVLFAFSYITYQLALTYYNSLLNDITESENFGIVSGLGVAARYTGTICGLLVIGFFIDGNKIGILPDFLHSLLLKPVAPGETVYANGFIPTAIIYFICVLPLFLVVKTKKISLAEEKKTPISQLFAVVWRNLCEACKSRNTVMLLVTMLLGGAPVYAAIHFMAVIITEIGGVTEAQVRLILLVCTVFAVAGGLAFGLLLRPIGNKIIFSIVLGLWGITFLVGSMISGSIAIWAIGVIAGVGMGGYWATARILFMDVAPPGRQGEYLSLFGMFVVLCGILGSLVWRWGLSLAALLELTCVPQRVSIFLLSLLGFVAMWTFSFVEFPNRQQN